MDDLARLVALEAIRDLARRYALAADGKDLEAMALLFAPDVDNGRWGPGRDGVKAFYAQSLRKFHCSIHFVANHTIDFDGDDRASPGGGPNPTARGVVYCHARHHVLEPDEHWFDEALAYFDTYERIDGAWCFRRRRLRSWYRQHTTEREVPEILTEGPKRGARLPEAFPTFEPFWA